MATGGPKLSEAVQAPLAKNGWMEGPLSKLRRTTFQTIVMQALQLRRTHREVFILCEVKGYKVSEAAAILGISEASAGRRLRQARSQMVRMQNSTSGN